MGSICSSSKAIDIKDAKVASTAENKVKPAKFESKVQEKDEDVFDEQEEEKLEEKA